MHLRNAMIPAAAFCGALLTAPVPAEIRPRE